MRPVDLVDDHDGPVAQLQGLPQHEAGLRHGAFGGIDQQQHAVHHVQHALHLAAEVGVAGRVHDVDLDGAVADGRVLRQDRDAALALQIVRVHHPFGHVLVVAENFGLLEHRVDQCGLAVVDVRDNGDVADTFLLDHTNPACPQHKKQPGRTSAAAGQHQLTELS